MDPKRGLRALVLVLGWLPVGLLLSAASCETPRERSDREYRERMQAEMQLQQMMAWNALQKQKLEEERVRQQLLSRGPVVLPPPPFDFRSGRNPQEGTFRIDIPDEKL